MDNTDKTALVTGANAGLGFEAAAQLAEAGWGTVILACRSVQKAEQARIQLTERTGKDPFQTLAIDTSEVDSANRAAETLAERGSRIDFLLLNAGASKAEPAFNSRGHEITYASTLTGHHVLTMRALEHGLLTETARIVIAGSEGARGNMPGMPVHDIGQIATEQFGGDVPATIEALFHLGVPVQTKRFTNMREYVTAKLIVAWWAAGLSRRLPRGTTVNAVSPGAALGTTFARHAPAAMRYVMLPIMKLLGPVMGMNGPVSDGAARYLQVEGFGPDDTGNFYATAHPKKLVGPIGIQTEPTFFVDRVLQDAGFAALIKITGVGMPETSGEPATA